MIHRLTAQRAYLNEAARRIKDLPGCVFELGLGSGRTFDHLRSLLPDREIFAFDRAISAHPTCIPDADHMILGGPSGARLLRGGTETALGVRRCASLNDALIATTNKGVPAVLEGKSIAAKEFIRIAKRLSGIEVDAREGVGFFTRLGRALGLSASPA